MGRKRKDRISVPPSGMVLRTSGAIGPRAQVYFVRLSSEMSASIVGCATQDFSSYRIRRIFRQVLSRGNTAQFFILYIHSTQISVQLPYRSCLTSVFLCNDWAVTDYCPVSPRGAMYFCIAIPIVCHITLLIGYRLVGGG